MRMGKQTTNKGIKGRVNHADIDRHIRRIGSR